jgi:hypothetical protein
MGPALREVRLGGGAAVDETWSRQRRSCWTRLGRGSGGRPYEPGLRPITRHRIAAPSTGSRLTAAGQVWRPNDSRRRNLPFVDLRGDRPLYLLQRPLNSDGSDEGPNDSSPPRRSALRDPERSLGARGTGPPVVLPTAGLTAYWTHAEDECRERFGPERVILYHARQRRAGCTGEHLSMVMMEFQSSGALSRSAHGFLR